MGSAKARELYLLNRKVRALEAKDIGLVSDVYPAATLMEEVLRIADTIAEAAPLALQRIKLNLNDGDSITSFSEGKSRNI